MTIVNDSFSGWNRSTFGVSEFFDHFDIPDPSGSRMVREYFVYGIESILTDADYLNSRYIFTETSDNDLNSSLLEVSNVKGNVDSIYPEFGVVGISSKDDYNGGISKLLLHDLDSTCEITSQKTFGLDTTNSFNNSLEDGGDPETFYYDFNNANTRIEYSNSYHTMLLYGINNLEVHECKIANRTAIEQDSSSFSVQVYSNLQAAPAVFKDDGEVYASGLCVTNNDKVYFVGYVVTNARGAREEEIIWTDSVNYFRQEYVQQSGFRIRKIDDLMFADYLDSSNSWSVIGGPFDITESGYNWITYLGGVVSASNYGTMRTDFTNFSYTEGELYRDGGDYPVVHGNGTISNFSFTDSTSRLEYGQTLVSVEDREDMSLATSSLEFLVLDVGLIGDKLINV